MLSVWWPLRARFLADVAARASREAWGDVDACADGYVGVGAAGAIFGSRVRAVWPGSRPRSFIVHRQLPFIAG